MTIGDEKVVYQQRELTRMDDGKWRDCSKAIFDRINDDRYVASETRALIPQSAYAELAAELATYKADTQKLREILGDSPAAKLVIELDTVRAEKKAAESQLAELRGKAEDWTHADEAAANTEGWCVSNSSDGCVEIQRLDEAEVFSEDGAAIAHVYWSAGAGSALHQKALAVTLRGSNRWTYTLAAADGATTGEMK